MAMKLSDTLTIGNGRAIAGDAFNQTYPGDILVTNDAYTTGSHLNHFTFTMPVFHENELIGFTCCMAHWLDVGGDRKSVV